MLSVQGSAAPEESADIMGALNFSPKGAPGVEGVLNASQGYLAEVNPENEGCILETETIKRSVHAKMASEVLGTPGNKRTLESKEISGTDEVTNAMQILRLRE